MVSNLGTSALPLLQSGQPPIETVLTTVLNELRRVPDDVYLVLDDYHLSTAPPSSPACGSWSSTSPTGASGGQHREDPELPLARLRARGELVEVRAADLRFGDRRTVWRLRAGLRAAGHRDRPGFIWELSLGIYLMVKSFKPSPITTGMAADPTPPVLSARTA